MKTYRQFTLFTDAIKDALVTKFNVSPDVAEEWLLDYVADMPDTETRTTDQIAQEIFTERAA